MAFHKTSKIQPSIDSDYFHQPFTYQEYEHAAGKASWYFQTLNDLVESDHTLASLNDDFRSWHKAYKRPVDHLPDNYEQLSIWQKLQVKRDLDSYLRKTIQYLFIRDLGKDLNDQQINDTIESVVDSIIKATNNVKHHEQHHIDSHLYRMAQKRGIEKTYHWLLLKLAEMRELFHAHHAETEGMRKLVKIIAGVIMHQLVEQPDSDAATLNKTIRLGYCYGLTYPFIDDLLDTSPELNEADKLLFNQALRETLQTGRVAPLPQLHKPSATINRIYQELKWAFEFIQRNLAPEQAKIFFKRAYIFFEAQAIDRERRLGLEHDLTMKTLFMPVMLKAAGCRLIARDLIAGSMNAEFDHRTFCFGIYNQFNDDIKDIFEDLEENNLTPYTYFLTRPTPQPNDVSPYQFYWAVVYYLITVVYQNEPVTKALFLERCINAHRSLKQKVGHRQYESLRKSLLYTNDPEFDATIDRLIVGPVETAWFDKLVSQELASVFDDKRQQQQQFKSTYQELTAKVEQHLNLTPLKRLPDGRICDSGNYALYSGGKRLRSVLAYFMGQSVYHFDEDQCKDMATMLEYMHTASLIFDDLPSQDNADVRRGKPTLHIKYQSPATAELSAVYLMMRAVEIQSDISNHPPQAVLNSLKYAANTTQLICEGQLEDIKPEHNQTEIEDIEKVYWLKTGLAIEAALVIPALLAEQDDIHISYLKKLARHLGMAFQIKDDLLDFSGDSAQLGKPVSQDTNKDTIISLLGQEQSTEWMFMHYYKANEIINTHLPESKSFLQPLLNFIIYRHH